MKIIKLLLFLILFSGITYSQDFDVSLFQTEMQKEMKKAFPYMELDTSLYKILKADYKDYYPGRQTILIRYANSEGNEHKMAVDAVKKYRAHLSQFFHEENLPTCQFRWFCAYAHIDYKGGLMRYAIMIDNRLNLDDLIDEK